MSPTKKKMLQSRRARHSTRASSSSAARLPSRPLHLTARAPPNLFQKYSQALRTPYLVASLIPVLAAAALAWRDGVFEPVLWAIAGLAALLAHAGTNLANDYFDFHSGNFPSYKRGPTGGSFAIQHGLFTPRHIALLALSCFSLSLLLFAYLAWNGSILILLLGALGIAIGFFYTAPPLSLGYRPLGELAIFFGMGPLLFQTVYFAQAGQFSLSGWALSTFLGLLVANTLLAAQLPDIEEDIASRKRTIASIWGPQALATVFLASTVIGALALVYGVLSLGLPASALLGLGGSLISLRAYTRLREGHALEGLDGSLTALQVGGALVIFGLLLLF